MRRSLALSLVLGFAAALLSQQLAGAEGPPAPPVAERKPVTSEHHGIAHVDEYAWLQTEKLEEVLQRPEALEEPIRRHLEAESQYARAMLAPNRALERRLVAEMRGRVSRRDEAVPEPWGRMGILHSLSDRLSAQAALSATARGRTGAGAARRERAGPRPARLFGGGHGHQPGPSSSSPTRSTRTARSAIRSRIRDIATGQDLADTIPEVRGGAVWSKDGQWLFYVGRDPTKWGQKVFRHRLGTPHRRGRARLRGDGGGLLRVAAADALRSLPGDRGRRLLDRRRQAGRSRRSDRAGPRTITERKQGQKYVVTDLGDRLVFLTNADGAIDWKIVDKPLAAPRPTRRCVRSSRTCRGASSRTSSCFASISSGSCASASSGRQQIRIRRWSDGAEHAIAFGEEPSKVEIQTGLEQGTRRLRYTYQSLAQPKQVFDYDMETRQRTLRKVQDVPSGHDPARYVTRRLVAPAAGRHAACPSPSSTTGAPSSTARRRSGCTATAPTATSRARSSAPSGCRWWTAASSMPSPTCAAAARRAMRGTMPAGSPTRRPRSPTTSPSPSISSGAGSPGRAASSPPAPRPAARWWARSPTCARTCSAPSMPRCRSSTR